MFFVQFDKVSAMLAMDKNLTRMTGLLLSLIAGAIFSTPTWAQQKPNILVIWGDDIGITNISAYSRGMMGYETPNIYRIANEGALFTDYYA